MYMKEDRCMNMSKKLELRCTYGYEKWDETAHEHA